MTNRKQITEPADMARIIVGGAAVFTLVSVASGKRFTYKAKAPKEALADGNTDFPVIFISVLSDSDNEGRYSYLGQVFPPRSGLHYIHGKKAKAGSDAPSSQLIRWFLGQLHNHGSKLHQVEFWHEGKCARCGRKLIVPESIDTGFGPECAAYMGVQYTKHSRPTSNPKDPKPLSFQQERAMDIIHMDGAVIAGTSVFEGRVVRVQASTLRSLEKRGLVTLHIGPDGGMMARAVEVPASVAPENAEAEMQRMEAEGDREQSEREERAKWAAREAMEGAHFDPSEDPGQDMEMD